MNIVLVNHNDPRNIHSFSGTSYFMSKAIRNEFEYVVDYDSFDPPELNGRVFFEGLEPMLKPLGLKLSKFLLSCRDTIDFVLSIGGSSCVPYCNTDIPMVLWHDSTWHTFLQGYSTPEDFRQFRERATNYYLWDKAVVQRADLLVYSSYFIAEACVRDYGAPSSKVKVIPFGANIDVPPAENLLNSYYFPSPGTCV